MIEGLVGRMVMMSISEEISCGWTERVKWETYRGDGGLGWGCRRLCERESAGDDWSAPLAFVTRFVWFNVMAEGRRLAVISAQGHRGMVDWSLEQSKSPMNTDSAQTR